MSDQDPLTLYQALEEEYISLHGPLPDDYYQKNLTPESRLKAIYKLIHALPEKRAALCISGGGIRSATFALGLLQGIARCRVLDKFDYLSTVSGGGYVGSWLSAWIHRDPEGAKGVFEKLKGETASELEPEVRPIRHLRSYSNYLSPKLGLLSADAWTLAAIIGRNLILNWFVLIPLLLAMLMVPRLSMSLIGWELSETMRPYFLWVALVLGFLSGVMGVVYMGLYRPSNKTHRSKRLRSCEDQGSFLCWCLLPLLVSAFSLALFWAWFSHSDRRLEDQLSIDLIGVIQDGPLPLIAMGVAVYVLAWLIYSSVLKSFNFRELLVIPPVGAAGGVFLYVLVKEIFPKPVTESPLPVPITEYYACFALPLILALFLLAVAFFVGVSSRFTNDEDREWIARFAAWVLIAIVAWSAIHALVIFGPAGLLYLETEMRVMVASAGGVSGVITILLGRSSKTPAQERKETEGAKSFAQRILLAIAAPVFAGFLLIAMSLCSDGLILLAGNLFSWMEPRASLLPNSPGEHLDIIHNTPILVVLVLVAAMLFVGIVMAFFININKFSLHAMYRNRLIRAYLGASREKRNENRFTGFDPDDNVQMHELRPELFHRGSFSNPASLIAKLEDAQDPVSRYLMQRIMQVLNDEEKKTWDDFDASKPEPVLGLLIKGLNEILDGNSIYDEERFKGIAVNEETRKLLKQKPEGAGLVVLNRLLLEQAYPQEIKEFRSNKPLHVVNMALNLVKGSRLAWQQRKAESFTVSPLHSGSYTVGDECGSYRRSKEYGNAKEYDGVYGISLGTAVAISGAAVSPNMGYHSSSVITFLLTLFNARLGWWLGNPGKPGNDVYRRPSPFFSIGPMIAEAFGLTDDKKRYVYLSDGGHFENLALYEMVLRRCRFIVVSDASQDPEFTFSDLGGALRKIRIDLGIPIDFHDKICIFPKSDDAGRNEKGRYCAVGEIHYSCVDGPGTDGILIYFKPAIYGDEPADITSYARDFSMFPHETTGDQFFSESQFESYRMLGSHVMNGICGEDEPRKDTSLDEFLKMVYLYLGIPVPQELENRIQAASGKPQPLFPVDGTGV